MVDTVLDRWETAKDEFTRITGKKKPKPNGLIAKAFNHSGLTKAMKECDKALESVEKERDQAKRAKLLSDAAKKVAPMHSAAKDYIKVLDSAIKDEIADKGEKTDYSKGLKYLSAQLDALAKWYDAKIDQQKIAADQSTGAAEKAVKMVQKSVVSTLANAVAGLKKVKADPTPATFNEIFNQSDNPARKLQVQLVAAANGQKKGLLPTRGIRVDPRTVADMLTPWQAGGKGQAIATDDMDKAAILKRLGELADIVKLAKAFVDDLVNAAG